MSRTEGSTKEQTDQRVEQALDLLVDGYAPASIAKSLAMQHKVSLRQARRYVQAAEADYFDAPMSRNDLEYGIARQLERMEEIAEAAMLNKELETEIKARKAFSTISEARLKSHQREDQFHERMAKQYC